MSFVRFDSEGHLTDREGRQVHIVGVNYVASYICTNFWEDWRPEIIEQDLKNISQLGLNAVRIPMHWGFMEPEQGRYNPDFEARFASFMKMCHKYELYIMPWFLVGVATNEYDVPFRNGRSFFDDEMVQAEEAHLKHFIAPYRDDELILFWDICDEPEWYSRMPGAEQLPYNRAKVVRWVRSMYDAIQSADPNHLITLGFGHIATADYGMDVRDMAQILDLMVVTAYPNGANEGVDTARNNYTVSFHVKMNTRKKPVFTCEAPGMSSILYAEEAIGRYFKVSLYSNLINGSTGVLPWVYNDFEQALWHEMPLEKYLIEARFGIVDVNGRVKPSGQEICEFASFTKKADIGRFRPQKAEAAILVPDGHYPHIRFTYEKIYTAFLLAKGCNVDVDLIWTSDNLSGYRLLILPTVAGMTTSSWDKVRRFVENGGVLYHTYENGAQNVYFQQLFGVEIRANETDYGYQEMAALIAWGAWNPGDRVPLTGTGREDVLRVQADHAETLFVFDDGEAALLRNEYGTGTAYLATVSMDSGLMKIPYREYLNTKSFTLLDNLIEEAGICRIVRFSHPAIEVGCMESSVTEELLLICINHDNGDIKTNMAWDIAMISSKWEVHDFATGESIDIHMTEKSFRPAEVIIYKLSARHSEIR